MKIAIVNDMPLAVEALRRAVALEPAHQVVWVASNGAEAVQRCTEQLPDLILMDLIMPVMDGVEATRRIMAETPCAIVIVTVYTGYSRPWAMALSMWSTRLRSALAMPAKQRRHCCARSSILAGWSASSGHLPQGRSLRRCARLPSAAGWWQSGLRQVALQHSKYC